MFAVPLPRVARVSVTTKVAPVPETSDTDVGNKIETDTSLPNDPSYHEQVASLAHWLWQESGCPEGSSEADWYQAEQLLEKATDDELVKSELPE